MRPIDADAFVAEINDRIENAIKWGVNAIADRNDEIKLRAEQAVATFCEASLTAKKMPTIDAVPWMWLEVFAKTKPFDSVDEFITEAKEMNRKMYSCCCADGERRE